MPTAESFVLIGGALWLAENLATLLGAWRYPDQRDRWHLVHVGKLGSWALLVTLSFVLVAAVKAKEGTLYGDGAPRVMRARSVRKNRMIARRNAKVARGIALSNISIFQHPSDIPPGSPAVAMIKEAQTIIVFRQGKSDDAAGVCELLGWDR